MPIRFVIAFRQPRRHGSVERTHVACIPWYFPRSGRGTKSAYMIFVIAMHPPPPKPCTAECGVRTRHTSQRYRLTSSGYEHVHALGCPRDGGPDGKGDDKPEEDWFSAERGREVANEREDRGGRDGVGAPRPYEVGAV